MSETPAITFSELPVADIRRRNDARKLDDATVDRLVASICEVGLINPIRVRQLDSLWQVIAGSHRLAAFERVNAAMIPAIIVTEDDLRAELSMIDENLCRAELSASDRAVQTARRKSIYEELHPETRQGGAPGLAGGGKAKVDNLSSFADATADATGRDPRSVRRDAERGEKVSAEVLSMVKGTKLDTGAYLDKLKKLPASEQFTIADRDLKIDRQKDRQAKAKAKTPATSTKVEADVKARALASASAIIADHVPKDDWNGLKANLYAAGLTKLADALTTIFDHRSQVTASENEAAA